jgi:SRSO17 transposase
MAPPASDDLRRDPLPRRGRAGLVTGRCHRKRCKSTEPKGECGLDDYQGQLWDGFHRHVTLVMLTYGFLAQQRQTVSSG